MSQKKYLPFVCALIWTLGSAPLAAQPAPAGDLELSLRRLTELGSVLMIGAHPDDERTNVLAWLARGRHMRTAYLSITRGEGGQNLIGAEQGSALGLIRTQELLAARKIDGAEQFFTRAIDFGFSKTVAETMQKWGHEDVLSDIVWVIRRFRPDVVILCFHGTHADGHAHHQASAILGKEAAEAAGDLSRFPEQLRYVQPWRPAKVVSDAGFDGRGVPTAAGEQAIAPVVAFDTTGYSTFLGYSYAQLAAVSRRLHRSQGFGNIGFGDSSAGRGSPAASSSSTVAMPFADVFEGIEHTWKRLAGGEAIGAFLDQAIREFNPAHPDQTIPLLARIHPLIAAMSDPMAAAKLADLDELIGQCAGIWAEAATAHAEVTPGSRVVITATVYPRLLVEVKIQEARVEGMGEKVPIPFDRQIGAATAGAVLKLPRSQPYSQPYWLSVPPVGERYTVEDPILTGLPERPPVRVRFRLIVAGVPIELVRTVECRYAERAEAERTRPLIVVPAVSVKPSSSVAIFPTAASRTIQVETRANVPDTRGVLRLSLPPGWKAEPQSRPFQMDRAGEVREMSFDVTPPSDESCGILRAVASVNGREIAVGMQTISYPHIPIEVFFPPAEVKVVRSDIKVTAHHVGYIMGAGDDVPETLRQLGIDVALLGEQDLANKDLSHFDAIVAGVRAYNVRPDLRSSQSRLLEYVKNGGTLLVQYMSAGAEEIGPYPISIPANNDYRVTVEQAPVSFTHPASPLLTAPNRITEADFDGWIQERGLLFPNQWDPRYETVLSAGDPGEKPLEGGELWTRYGKGEYIFTAWAWFRELPAGIPGAYRLFANLLSAR
jgi:LmbE family N-acetylglucosaminyl deacetylase